MTHLACAEGSLYRLIMINRPFNCTFLRSRVGGFHRGLSIRFVAGIFKEFGTREFELSAAGWAVLYLPNFDINIPCFFLILSEFSLTIHFCESLESRTGRTIRPENAGAFVKLRNGEESVFFSLSLRTPRSAIYLSLSSPVARLSIYDASILLDLSSLFFININPSLEGSF